MAGEELVVVIELRAKLQMLEGQYTIRGEILEAAIEQRQRAEMLLERAENAVFDVRAQKEQAENRAAVLASALEWVGETQECDCTTESDTNTPMLCGVHAALANLPAAVKAAQERTVKLEAERDAAVEYARIADIARADVLWEHVQSHQYLGHLRDCPRWEWYHRKRKSPDDSLLCTCGYSETLERRLALSKALKPAEASPERARDATPESR